MYSNDDKPALEDVSLALPPGSLTALVGSNGAGNPPCCTFCMVTHAAGQWLVAGQQPIRSCRARVALMPQRGRIDWSFPITIREMVILGQPPGIPSACCEMDAVLQRVGLIPLAARCLDALSGGQQQRILLARELMQPSRVLLLDEPCAAIAPSREQLLQQLTSAGTACS